MCKRDDFAPRFDEDETVDFCPIVWVFEDDPNQTYEPTTYVSNLGSGHVYYTAPALLVPSRCTRHTRYLAAMAVFAPWHFLRSNKAHYGRLPWWMQSRGFPIPTQDPWFQHDNMTSRRSRPYELLIWAAILHARTRVIVASDTGARVSAAISSAAAARNIRLIEVNLRSFSPSEVENLRNLRFEQMLVEDIF
jgi:hypothetical protein